MTPVIPSSMSNVSLISGAAFTLKKSDCSVKCGFPRKSGKQLLYLQRLILPLPISLRLFPAYARQYVLHSGRRNSILSATGTDVAVEEQDSPVADENSGGDSESQSATAQANEKSDSVPTTGQPRRTRPGRKSEMPPVENEELVPGATFTGKVRAIQPFGAFIDFGAFTDGLVHVSRLSDSFVKDVSNVVSIGQEVKVRLVEANFEAGRISLSMRENDEPPKRQTSSDKTRPTKKNALKTQKKEDVKTSKFIKGQELEGKVKNLTRSGAFISLSEGEEGFLPTSEEADDGLGSMMGGSSLQVGQEVNVRVLRITRGQVTLTMKKEDDNKFDEMLSAGVVHTATNPFVLAFRENKDIAAFLDRREEEAEKEATEKEFQPSKIEVGGSIASSEIKESLIGSEEADEEITSQVLSSETPEEEEALETKAEGSLGKEELQTETLTAAAEDSSEKEAQTETPIAADEDSSEKEVQIKTPTAATEATPEKEVETETLTTTAGDSSEKEVQTETPIAAAEHTSEAELLAAAAEDSSEEEVQTETPIAAAGDSSEEARIEILTAAAAVSSEKEVPTETPIAAAKDSSEKEEGQTETPVATAENEEAEMIPDKNGSAMSSEAKPDIPSVQNTNNGEDSIENTNPSDSSTDQVSYSEARESKEVEKKEAVAEALIHEAMTPASVVTEASPDGNGNATNSGGGSSKESIKASISPALVKQLREETGSGMMDCKKALSETGGDIVKALEYLRKKGLASAEKKASRATAEGRIGAYIHDSRIGVLLEVNCETDFVSRGEIFKELGDDLAMQVAACPQVEYVVTEDVPEEIVKKEKEIEMQKEDLLSKPEQIREKIVEGRVKKRLEALALLEQPYIKDDKVAVKDWVKQTIATVGENIKVKRFMRYNLGEGLEKKSQDFAAEVAAQTAAKPKVAPENEQPKAEEPKEAVEKPATVAVSAALVKQLREETGAGMMDCKKALAETGGDLEKAQEYLRKKGLSTADKKSSRLAAEGRIGSYIHDSRIGVLIEVNSETDFVGRSEKFKELVDDLAMQAVANPQVQYVSIEDIPEETRNKEKEIEMQREDILSKPDNIKEKIVEGRVNKRLGELALLEQPYIKDDSILVKDLVKQAVAAIGENIKVRRFVRFTLGEDN